MMLHLPKEPIKQRLVRLAGVLFLVVATIMATEVFLRQRIMNYWEEENNQMSHRRLGRVIIRELISVERDVAQLVAVTDIRDVNPLHEQISYSLDSINAALQILQHGGVYVDVLPANLNDKDQITETFGYWTTNENKYNISVIDLTPKIFDLKVLCNDYVNTVKLQLSNGQQTNSSEASAKIRFFYKRLHTDLLRARENASKIFYETHQKINRLTQQKNRTVFYITLTHYLITMGVVIIGAFTFSRIFKQISDILTKRKEDESRIKTLNRQMEYILRATQTGVDIITPDHDIQYIDPGWAAIYGDHSRRKCYDYFKGRQEPCENCGIEIALRTHEPVVTEETLPKENNRPIQVTTIPYQDEHGNWLVAEVKVDISERKKLDEELERYRLNLEEKVKERTQELVEINESLNREIEERSKAEKRAQQSHETLQKIIDSMPVGVVIISKDKIIKQANKAALKLTGHQNLDDLVGLTCHSTFCPADVNRCPILNQGKSLDKSERKLITTSGQEITILKSAVSVMIDQEEMLLETFTDITKLKEAEAQLKKTTQDLVEASHQAGKAEVASNVLHNVGNVLNSVNVSTTLIKDTLQNSEVSNLKKVSQMIETHLTDLGDYITHDTKGKVIPTYLVKVAQVLDREQVEIRDKIDCLANDINHIKEIIQTQQAFSKSSGVEVHATLEDVFDDALRINQDGLDRYQIQVQREHTDLGEVYLNRPKVMQILVNLIANAKHALQENPEKQRLLILRSSLNGDETLRIEVIDNGVGISSEHLVQIFTHGFTTKENGHGFGLHSGALTAKEMGGTLSVVSEGVGKGACFILDIPYIPVGVQQ